MHNFFFLRPLKILLHSSLIAIVLLHPLMLRIILLILAPLFCNPLFFLLVAFEISLYHNVCEISLYCDWGDVCMYMHMCNFPSYLGKCLIRLVCLSTYLYFNSGEFVSSYFKYFFFLLSFCSFLMELLLDDETPSCIFLISSHFLYFPFLHSCLLYV